MTLNYKHRFILAITSYTFVLILTALAVFWLIFEYLEEADNKKPPFWLNQQITAALKDHELDRADRIEQEFQIYSTRASLPKILQKYSNYGLHDLGNGDLLMLGQHPSSRDDYYLIIHQAKEIPFWQDEFEDIVFVLTSTVLLTISMVFSILYMAKKLTLPVIELQEKVRNIDINSQQLPLLDREDEVGQLSRHFSELIKKMRQFALRERDFTRFSSHELRTPVTVIRGNLDLLHKTIPETEINLRILKRMDIATTRMSNLIDMFLCLSREGDVQDTFGPEKVDSQALKEIFEAILQTLSAPEKERIEITYHPLNWYLSPVMLAMIIDNLLRNALRHSSEQVLILASENRLLLSNAIDHSESVVNEGIGLQIVRKICQANHWTINIHRDDNFCVELKFT